MINQKITQGLLVSTIKNANGDYISQVSGDEMLSGSVTVQGSSLDELINRIKANVQEQPDFVWEGIKSAITCLLYTSPSPRDLN